MEAIQICYEIFSASILLIIGVIIIAHVICWFIPKKPVILKKDSLVVITGGCMGIGRRMALEIANLYKYLRKDLFVKVQKQIEAQGGTSICYQTNLADPKQVQKLIDFLKQQPRIDLFIYNAGIVIRKRAQDTSDEEHMSVMRVNYLTPIALIHALTDQLQGSHIAVVASIVAIVSGGIDFSTYTSSKHAIFGYLASLRQQYKKDKKNVTLSVACPYLINTTMFQGLKTKFNFLSPTLDEKYVGKRLVRQFIQKKQICFIYQYQALLFRIVDWMPTELIDWMQINLIIQPQKSKKDCNKTKGDQRIQQKKYQ